MKKILATVLCLMLALSSTLALAEVKPWLYMDEAAEFWQSGQVENATVKVTLSLDSLMSFMSANDPTNASVYQMITEQYGEALNILMDNLRIDITSSYADMAANLRLMLSDSQIAELKYQIDTSDGQEALYLSSDVFPSYVLKADYASLSPNIMKNGIAFTQSILDKSAVFSDMDPIDELCGTLNAYLNNLMGDNAQLSLTAEEFKALDEQAIAAGESPFFKADGLVEIVYDLFKEYQQTVIEAQSLQIPENIGDLNIGLYTLFNNDEQGDYALMRDGDAVTLTCTLDGKVQTLVSEPRRTVFDQMGAADNAENIRVTLDGRQDNLIQLRAVGETLNGWINFARDSFGESVSGNVSISEDGLNIGVAMNGRCSYEGIANVGVKLSLNGKQMLGVDEAIDFAQGDVLLPDTANLTIAEIQNDGTITHQDELSAEAQATLMSKLQDVLTTKMPAGTEMLTAFFSALLAQ